jgi:hypothetical protein
MEAKVEIPTTDQEAYAILSTCPDHNLGCSMIVSYLECRDLGMPIKDAYIEALKEGHADYQMQRFMGAQVVFVDE